MKITSLNLLAFGRFTNYSLNFGGDQDFHVIYGPNEAGKSTCMRALRGLLYGIKNDTTDNFIHPMNKMRVGAVLERRDGTSLTVIRRKGNTKTLSDATEGELSDSVLEQFLGGVSSQVFETFFHLDHESLVRGGKSLLESDGNAAESIFQAGSGFSGLHKLLSDLEVETGQLFKTRATTSLINRALNDLKEANKLKRDESLRPQVWIEKEKSLKDLCARIEDLRSQIGECQTDQLRLDRWKLALPSARIWADSQDQLLQLGEVVELAETATADRVRVVAQRESAHDKINATTKKIEEISKTLEEITLNPDLIAQGEAINHAYRQLAQYQQNVDEAPRVEKEVEGLQGEIDILLENLGYGLTAETVDGMRPSEKVASEIRKLLEKYPSTLESISQTQAMLKGVEANLHAAQDALHQHPAKADVSALRSVLSRAGLVIDSKKRLEAMRASHSAQEHQLQLQLQRLPGWNGTAEELELLPTPLNATITGFQSELDALNSRQSGLDIRVETAAKDRDNLKHQIDEMQGAGQLPTEADLVEARTRRDEAWQLIRTALSTGPTPSPNEVRVSQGVIHGYLLQYETISEDTDVISDTLRRESTNVARLMGLNADLRKQEGMLRGYEQDQTDILDDKRRWEEEWRSEWQPTGIEVLSPPEMVEWLAAAREITRASADLRSEQAKVPPLESQLAEWEQDMRRVLLEHCEQPRLENESLEAFVHRAGQLLERRESDGKSHEKLEEQIASLIKERGIHTSRLSDAELKLSEWEEHWKRVVSHYGPLSVVAPDAFGGTLDQFNRLRQLIELRRVSSRDLKEKHGMVERFEGSVLRLVMDVAQDLQGVDAQLAVPQLFARFSTANEEAATFKAKKAELFQHKQDLEEANINFGRASSQLQELLNKAKCQDLESLEAAERNSASYRELTNKKKSAYDALLHHADGLTVPELVAELDSKDVIGLEQEILEIKNRLSDLNAQNEKAVGDERVLANEIETGGSSEVASEAAQNAANAIGQIRAASETYIQKRLALEILKRQIEIYRAENQGPILEQANPIFKRLTGGKYSALKVGYDRKDTEILLGIRDNDVEVQVDTMSEGTRDQLYLALRLASLKKQLSAMSEPIPVIVDDVLINFDDQRACATLQVLGELSRKTQIIFFTHHQRLVELTKSYIPLNGVVKMHEIDHVTVEGQYSPN